MNVVVLVLILFYVLFTQIWDFASAEKLQDVPENVDYRSQVCNVAAFLSRKSRISSSSWM